MAKKDKLTIADILKASKATINNNMKFYSESLDCTFEYEKICPSKVQELVSQTAREEMEEYNSSCYLIYLSCPILRAEELQSAFEVKGSPYEVVDKIFNSNIKEISFFSTEILSLYGFGRSMVEAVKK